MIDNNEFTNIVASKSGTITKIIAQNGTAIVKEGDNVEKGQVLISGTMEGKYTGIRNVHSLGEVEAIVKYTKSEKLYYKEEQNVKTGKKEEKYQLKINKIQINFYKTLSKFKIYDTIEENKKLKVFSNLYLPISVTKITNYELEENSKNITREDLTQKGTQKLKEGLEKEIGKDKNILRNISRRTRK